MLRHLLEGLGGPVISHIQPPCPSTKMPTATKFRIPPPPASSSADGGAAESSVGGGDQGPRPDSSRPDADARAAREDASPARSRAGTVNAGAWTADEHRLFLAGLEVHGEPPRAAAGSIGGTDWAAVASAVGSRTADQVRSHATTYFKRLARARPAPVAAMVVSKTQGTS